MDSNRIHEYLQIYGWFPKIANIENKLNLIFIFYSNFTLNCILAIISNIFYIGLFLNITK